MMIKFTMRILAPIISIAILLISGCIVTPVKYENRDSSGIYDGEWVGIVEGTEKYQRGGSYEYFCSPVEALLGLYISQGTVEGFFEIYRDSKFQAYKDKNGFFRAIIKSDHTWLGDPGSIAPMKKAFVIEGNLAKDGVNGAFVIALVIDGMNGCRSNIEFFRK